MSDFASLQRENLQLKAALYATQLQLLQTQINVVSRSHAEATAELEALDPPAPMETRPADIEGPPDA